MEFPNITFKHGGVAGAGQLELLVKQKFESLTHYVGTETDVLCEVEFQRETARQSGNIFRVEANIWLAGKLFRAESTEGSFEKAIDAVRAELDTEMRRSHNKRESLLRRGGRKIKEMMRRGS